jgi:hypothetical protein
MEKSVQKIAQRLLVIGFITLWVNSLHAQCTGGTVAGAITPTLAWQTIPCIKGGEYYTFTANSGEFYTFSFCTGGGSATWDTQITILDNSGIPTPSGYADDECGLQSHLWYWTPPMTGTYRVLVTKFNCISGSTCGTLAYHTELNPYGGPGVSCGNPWIIPSIPYSQSGLTSCYYGNEYTSGSVGGCGSSYMNGEDFVMRYNGTAGQCISIYTNNTFIYTGLFLVKGCPGVIGSTCVAYHEASSGNPNLYNVTLPSTGDYYIIIDMNPIQPPGCSPFDITVVPCVAIGQGATCATAFPVPSLPYNQVGFTTCGRGNTYTSAMACNSSYMNGEDFLFSYVSGGNECISVEVSNTQPRTGLFVYDGCPNLVGTNCIASQPAVGGNPKRRTISLTAPGTYYIMVSNEPSPSCTPFNIDIRQCSPSCVRNPNVNDFCGTPTLVSFGLNDTVCGFTNEVYTPDYSVDLDNDFCGSIENNGWFSFVADSSRMTLRIDVPECNYGYGIQAQIFQTADCINFTPRSNCWNPLLQSSGVIQATGLIVGNTYRLMLDGYANDDCSFQITRLGAPFPVVWSDFSAVLVDQQRVQIDWSTSQEVNNRGFYVQRGKLVGVDTQQHFIWESIEFVPSQGGPTQGAQYHKFDTPAYTGEPWYYRVQQVDMDGLSSFTDHQRVELAGPKEAFLYGIFPNPANERVTVKFYAPEAGATTLSLYNLSGMLVKQQKFDVDGQDLYQEQVQLGQLANGLYFYALSINGRLFKGKLDVLH